MNLTTTEQAFVQQRQRLVTVWPTIGAVMVAAVVGLAGWLWLTRPLMINPWAVFAALEANSLPDSTITLMASLVPIVTLLCLFIVVIGLFFAFVAFSREKKMLEIVGRLDAPSAAAADSAGGRGDTAVKRIWHGWTVPENADAYQALLSREVLPGIEAKKIPGYRGVRVLRTEQVDEVEFVTIMTFDSIDNVIAFQGEDYAQAYVPEAAQAVLKRWDLVCQHYDLVIVRP